MIKTNLPLGLTQDRRDDGSTRLTLFADIIFDHEHLEVAMRLIAASMEVARACCPHAKWEWRKGHRWCMDCEQWIPAFPPEDIVKGPKVGTKKVEAGVDDPLKAHHWEHLECKHEEWERALGWEDGREICKGCGMIRQKGTDDAPCSPRECKHTLWQWRRGKEKGTSIRFCADCKEVLSYDEEMVRDHNPFVFSCGDPKCRQCREYPNREIHGEHCLCSDCKCGEESQTRDMSRVWEKP